MCIRKNSFFFQNLDLKHLNFCLAALTALQSVSAVVCIKSVAYPRKKRRQPSSILFWWSRGAKFCQDRMKNSVNNRAFNREKLVHACYLTKIFQPTLINLAPLTKKEAPFEKYLPFLPL